MKSRARRGRSPASAEKRERILDAALACFVERGYHGTAVPQVAKEAGIAAGTLYHYFPGKEQLVNALYRKWKQEIARRVMTEYPVNAPVREQFRTMFFTMLDFALEHDNAFAFLELHHHGSYLDDESLTMENRLKDFGAMMVAKAQKDGAVRAGPTTLLMELVFGAFIGMMRAYWDGRTTLTAQDRELAEEACWGIIAP